MTVNSMPHERDWGSSVSERGGVSLPRRGSGSTPNENKDQDQRQNRGASAPRGAAMAQRAANNRGNNKPHAEPTAIEEGQAERARRSYLRTRSRGSPCASYRSSSSSTR